MTDFWINKQTDVVARLRSGLQQPWASKCGFWRSLGMQLWGGPTSEVTYNRHVMDFNSLLMALSDLPSNSSSIYLGVDSPCCSRGQKYLTKHPNPLSFPLGKKTGRNSFHPRKILWPPVFLFPTCSPEQTHSIQCLFCCTQAYCFFFFFYKANTWLRNAKHRKRRMHFIHRGKKPDILL